MNQIIQKGQKNIVVGGNFYGNIVIEKEEILPQELTSIPFVESSEILGRDRLVRKISETFSLNKKPILLYGLGGIGKSSIAKLYLEQYKSKYHHIVWINIYRGIKSSIYNNLDLKKNLKIGEINIDECVTQIFNLLRQIKGKSLLVFDNVSIEIVEYLNQLPKAPDWEILFTSRELIEEFNCIKVDEIDESDAINLFNYHSRTYFDVSDVKILVSLLKFHPLSIILYSKAIIANPTITKLSGIIELVKKIRLNDHSFGIKFRLPYDKNELFLINHLSSIFDFSSLSDEEIDVLKIFAYFPTINIDLEKIYYFFNISPPLLNERNKLLIILQNLRNKGWIDSEEINTYKIHRLIQVVYFIRYNPKNEYIMVFLHQLYNAIKNSGMVNTLNQVEYLPFVESSLNNHPDSVEHDIFAAIATDSDRLFEFVGRIDDSISYLERAIEMWLKFKNPEINLELAKTYHNLGVTYFQYKSDIEKSFEFQEKALTIRRKYVEITKEPHHSLAESYRQLSYYFQELHDYSHAEQFIISAIEVDKATLSPINPQHSDDLHILAQLKSMIGDWQGCVYFCAQSIEQRGKVHPAFVNEEKSYDTILLAAKAYAHLGFQEEAIPLLDNCISKFNELIPEESPKWQSISLRIAESYRMLNKTEEASKFYDKAFVYTQKYYGEKSFQFAELSNNIGAFYSQIGLFKEAVNFYNISMTIFTELFDENHIDVGISSMNMAHAQYMLNMFSEAFESALFAHYVFIHNEKTEYHLAHLHRIMAYIQIGLKQPLQAKFHISDCLEFAKQSIKDEDSKLMKDFIESYESIYSLCAELENSNE